MSFQYPFALFALIAIPILILIYILRNKFKEESAPSTYLWEISDKFLKKRNPLRKMEGLISLIIQIFAIAGMSLALAHPQFTLKGQADNIVFILDASASMNMKAENSSETKFALAKKDILAKANDAAKGSTFSLIVANDQPTFVCKDVTDTTQFELYLNTVNVTEYASSLETPLEMAQERFSSGSANLCVVASDKTLPENATLDNNTFQYLKYTSSDINYSLNSLSYSLDSEYITNSGQQVTITGSFYNYNDTNPNIAINIRFYIDGIKYPYIQLNAEKAQVETENTFSVTLDRKDDDEVHTKNFRSIKKIEAVIENKDCLDLDNSMTVYNNSSDQTTKILLVSDSPFYFESMFKAITNATGKFANMSISYKRVSSSSYESEPITTGYDIYIYDCYSDLGALPSDGAVWIFGSDTTIPNAGYTTSNRLTDVSDDEASLTYTNNTESLIYQQLTDSLSYSKTIDIAKFYQCSITSNLTTILEYDKYPMVFAGKNENNQREIVFSFDLHDSSLPIQYDFLTLMYNFINYSKPNTLSSYEFTAGQDSVLSISDDVEKIEITLPVLDENGKNVVETLSYFTSEYYDYKFEYCGAYNFKTYYSNLTYRSANVYVKYTQEEANPISAYDTVYSLVRNENTKKGDGLFDNILPIVIAASLLFAADWVLYAHEQY